MNIFEIEYDDVHCIKNALCQFFIDKNLQASIIRNVPIEQATQAYGNLENYSFDMLLNVKYNNDIIMTSYLQDVSNLNRHLIYACTSADIVFLHIDYRRVLINDESLANNLSGKSFDDIISELDKAKHTNE
jgi:hypothetical protein